MYFLTKEIIFPPVEFADDEGILAIGGDLSIERLKLSYSLGIFPWYNEDEPIIWHCPNPRFVLFPEKIIIRKSVQKTIDSNLYSFTRNQSFREVIRNCKTIKRKGQTGTWLNNEMEHAYITLHEIGLAHSAETWLNGQLVGGLYGIKIGNVFCGESMFSFEANASRFAFVMLVKQLQLEGIQLIDCQAYTPYLESFGAEFIPRLNFIRYLC
jgi:leucyl/phenylalanyl-tRNA---protein transferase